MVDIISPYRQPVLLPLDVMVFPPTTICLLIDRMDLFPDIGIGSFWTTRVFPCENTLKGNQYVIAGDFLQETEDSMFFEFQ